VAGDEGSGTFQLARYDLRLSLRLLEEELAINDKIADAPALRRDVASAAIAVSIALDNVARALLALSESDEAKLKTSIADIKIQSDTLNQLFDDLTGWHDDER
jgi:hypothetical protein